MWNGPGKIGKAVLYPVEAQTFECAVYNHVLMVLIPLESAP
jgi:hypothetical protein